MSAQATLFEEETGRATARRTRYILARIDRARGLTQYVSRTSTMIDTGPMRLETGQGYRDFRTVRAKMHKWTEDHTKALDFASRERAEDFRAMLALICRSRAERLRDGGARRNVDNSHLITWQQELAAEYEAARAIAVDIRRA